MDSAWPTAPMRLLVSGSDAVHMSECLVAERGLHGPRTARADLVAGSPARAIPSDPVSERANFERRADRILRHCWLGTDPAIPSETMATLANHDEP
jgi:hypothetical protein